jgi:carboxymethylenebutenolidase
MNIIEREVEIRTADGTADGFLYTPRTDERPAAGFGERARAGDQARWPGAMHLVDIGGIRDSHRGMAKQLAAEGYVVLLPNVFYRVGKAPFFAWPFKMDDEQTMRSLGALRDSLPPAAMVADGNAYIDFLAKQESVSDGGMGVIGYCFTGAMALRIAASRPDKIAAAASFHGGRLYTDDPASPHTLLPRVKARLYFGHAIEDRSMPKEAIEKFERALASWDGKYESETYQGAHHGWAVPDSPSYNRPQAERAFEKLTELFAASLM